MFENVKPLKLNSSEVNIWFTSDTHFGHRNIIKYCSRPYETTDEMDQSLINNWNKVVDKNDIIFHLGDFAFTTDRRWKELISKLNGHIYLIVGNHDQNHNPGNVVMNMFEDVQSQMLLKIDNRYIYLNHYPFLTYGGIWRGPENAVYQLFGHTHTCKIKNTGKDFGRMNYLSPYQYDVGVDNNNYTPISWNEVKDKIAYQVENGVPIYPEFDSRYNIPNEI